MGAIMTKYKITIELTVADTDAPPEQWLPYSIDQLLEAGESIDNFICEELE
jgi:hypothetical protein